MCRAEPKASSSNCRLQYPPPSPLRTLIPNLVIKSKRDPSGDSRSETMTLQGVIYTVVTVRASASQRCRGKSGVFVLQQVGADCFQKSSWKRCLPQLFWIMACGALSAEVDEAVQVLKSPKSSALFVLRIEDTEIEGAKRVATVQLASLWRMRASIPLPHAADDAKQA